MNGNTVWSWAHLGFTVALAAASAVMVVLLATSSNLLNTIPGAIVFVFVVPGTLLVFAINQVILFRRRPRVVRLSDKIVISIVAVLIVAAMVATVDDEIGFTALFIVVPLLMIAGIVSTIVIAVGNTTPTAPPAAFAPIEPGTTPVAQTLDELFSEPRADEPPAGSPYGPNA